MNNTKLKTSELRYRRLFETAQDGILLIDFETGMIVDVNPFLIKMLDYSKKDFLKKYLWEVGVFKDIAASKANFKTLQEKRYVRFEDLPLETKTGKKINVEFVTNAYKVDNETVIQCNIRDITDRKRIEKSLFQSEEKFHKIFKVTPYCIAITNFEDGRFIDINESFILTMGFTRKEILTNSSLEINLWVKRSDREQMISELSQGHVVVNREFLFRKKNGEIITILFSAQIIQLNDQTCIISSIVDITKQKITEKLLIEKNQMFNQVIETIPVRIFWKDKNLNFLGCNSLFAKDSGKKNASEIIGHNDFELGWEREGKLYQGDDRQVITSGKSKINYEEPQYRNGKNTWLQTSKVPLRNSNNEIIGVLGMYTDITEHKRTEQLINETKNRDEAMLGSIGDGVFATDIDGKIILFNRMTEQMTGITAADAIGKHYRQIVNFVKESDGQPSNDFISEAIENNKITEMANHVVLVRKDGSNIPVADSAAPIKGFEGKIIGCVVVFHDVTKEREIDKAKTEFVSLASHQLRTPLSTINWYCEMLLSEDVGKLKPKQRQYSQEVYHASQRMVSLVNGLLNVSRLEMGTFSVDPKLINVTQIAKTCLKDLRPQILKKKLVISQKYNKGISSIKVDSKLLTIILQNFLSNSVKYTKNNGKIGLTISKEKNIITIAVSDTGIGIPKNQQKDIWEKLFRADNAKRTDPDGSGLGLYIVKKIVDYIGGKVWFKPNKNRGTIFYASFPLPGMIKKTGDKNLIL
jgi:PAS domain S-box-containing protein